MKSISSVEARQNFSSIISLAKNEPVSISRNDKDVAVVLSSKRYDELKRLEDILYGKAAKLAIKEGLIDAKKSQELLDNI